MIFNRDSFFTGFRAAFGAITQTQVDALEALLGFIEDDDAITDVRWIAYILATTKHETANTFLPIAEYGKGKGKSYGVPDPETGQTYYGRGFVQLTWRYNYEKMSELLSVDLVNNPGRAMESEIAYRVMSVGMRHGIFTGKSLQHYISGVTCDYLHARKIINAMDKAELIESYAGEFEKILNGASEDERPTEALPAVATVPMKTETVTTAEPATATTPQTTTTTTMQAVVAPEPIVSTADTPPVQASQSATKSLMTTIVGWLTAIPTAIWGLMQGNAEVIKWALIVAGSIGVLYLLRMTVMDALRMWTRADPKKYNVK